MRYEPGSQIENRAHGLHYVKSVFDSMSVQCFFKDIQVVGHNGKICYTTFDIL